MRPMSSTAHSARDSAISEARRIAPVSMMVYRSRAVVPPSERELEFLLHQAQTRNRAESIRTAHDASVNSNLAVIVDGRVFVESPQGSIDIGADAGCLSVTESVPAAERLVRALAMRTASRCA